MSILRTIRGYILWTYERGSMQYDVMVTVILAFIFVAPYWVNFKGKPVERTPHQSGVVVSPDGKNGVVYQIDASAVSGKEDVAIRQDGVRIVEPMSGEVDV